jgi:hypothetical protein
MPNLQLVVSGRDAEPYPIDGDGALRDAIGDEAERIAPDVGRVLFASPDPEEQKALRNALIHEMTGVLRVAGDAWEAPDGTKYELALIAPGLE